MSDEREKSLLSRRQALKKFAIAGLAAYVTPKVLTVSEAEAGTKPHHSKKPDPNDRCDPRNHRRGRKEKGYKYKDGGGWRQSKKSPS